MPQSIISNNFVSSEEYNTEDENKTKNNKTDGELCVFANLSSTNVDISSFVVLDDVRSAAVVRSRILASGGSRGFDIVLGAEMREWYWSMIKCRNGHL